MGPAGPVVIRDLGAPDIPAAAALHHDVLRTQFVAGFGHRFLARYYQAYLASPFGLALAATAGPGGELLGVLLGATCPQEHYPYLVRHHGAGLGAAMLAGMARRPELAWRLLRTRTRRYLRGVLRALGRLRSPAPARRPPAHRVAEVTALLVSPDARGRGIAAALLDAAAARCRQAGAQRMELVTLAGDAGAAAFYSHLGWERVPGVLVRSGEHFLRYRLELATPPPSG